MVDEGNRGRVLISAPVYAVLGNHGFIEIVPDFAGDDSSVMQTRLRASPAPYP